MPLSSAPPVSTPNPPDLTPLSLTSSSSSSSSRLTNGTTISCSDPPPALQLSIPLPHTHLPTRIQIHLTIRPTSLLLFLTTTTRFGSVHPGPTPGPSENANAPSQPRGLVDLFAPPAAEQRPTTSATELGSFVVAMPNLRSPTSPPATTPLYVRESTLDTATRIARILASKTKRPCYVGNSMDFGSAGAGGSVEEVMAGVLGVVRTVLEEVEKADAAEKEGGEGR